MYQNEKLHQNEGQHHTELKQPYQITRQDNTLDLAAGLENAASIMGGLFDLLNTPQHYDENEADFLREQARRRIKKKDNQYRHRL